MLVRRHRLIEADARAAIVAAERDHAVSLLEGLKREIDSLLAAAAAKDARLSAKNSAINHLQKQVDKLIDKITAAAEPSAPAPDAQVAAANMAAAAANFGADRSELAKMAEEAADKHNAWVIEMSKGSRMVDPDEAADMDGVVWSAVASEVED